MPTLASTSQCACPPCICPVEPHQAVEIDGKLYCSPACARHHADGQACSAPHCNCEQAVARHDSSNDVLSIDNANNTESPINQP
ncbi:metallothionein [Pseudomonas vanderleydeniana]|uniref:Metallothionein n=1 Tax=Pseudomonas vanderleydeniana TaxID=2745495 RepID=A0A9E6TQU7_9PSED|nr:metallothionein [Pseudomonas vanderleydeniana]QXI26325.1 metallothionein [Pseudomonas vanderleydeniana]